MKLTIATPQEINKLLGISRKLSRYKKPAEFLLAPILQIPAIKQHRPKDCILVCVLAIARFYGITGDEDSIIKAYGEKYSDEKGSSYSDAKAFLEHLGFKTRYVGSDLASLRDAKRDGHPVLYDFRTGKALGHGVVFLGSDDQWTYWMDPQIGKYIKLPTRLHHTFEEDCASALEVWPSGSLKLSI